MKKLGGGFQVFLLLMIKLYILFKNWIGGFKIRVVDL